MEENKKKKSIIRIIILIVAIGLCFGLGYLVATLANPKPNIPVEEEVEEVETTIEVDEAITHLVDRLVAGDGCNGIEFYTNDHKVTVKDITNERLFKITELESFSSKGIESMSIEDVDTEIQKIFSKGYLFKPEEIDYKDSNCFQYTYDKDKQIFTKQETACGGSCGPNRDYYKVVNAVEKNDVLNVEVKVLFSSGGESMNIYSDYERLNLVTNDAEHIEDNLDKGSSYIFTFEKVDNNYLFVSSERA